MLCDVITVLCDSILSLMCFYCLVSVPLPACHSVALFAVSRLHDFPFDHLSQFLNALTQRILFFIMLLT